MEFNMQRTISVSIHHSSRRQLYFFDHWVHIRDSRGYFSNHDWSKSRLYVQHTAPIVASLCLAPPSPPFAAAAATAREHVPRRAVVLRLQSQARRTSRASRWCVCDSFSLDRHGMGSHDDGFRRSRAITRARASRDARVALYAIRSIDSRAVAREREGRRAILEGRATDDDRC
jgi:hypothetical protein